ncbi:ammonium transporter [Ravibacter arvi]|uniref:Ammonium transporter n=1 Tax=Ravibacter arvi TaxID=2051041 RepID=A0ABP8LT21_9BACT
MSKPNFIPLLILLLVSVAGLLVGQTPGNVITEGLDSGDTAWMIVSAAFVLLMTPGLAYFYGGMVNGKNVISTMLQSFIAMGVISIIWVVFGFSMAFGEDIGGIVGNPLTYFMLNGVMEAPLTGTIPFLLFAFFQLKFAVITPALITGSMAERVNFRSYVLFMILFCIFIYTPLAHMTWHADGLLFKMGVLDFAGGTVVHMSAGWAALAGALFLKSRSQYVGENGLPPANIPFVLLGTGLLWFGWFGFNAGSALSAGTLAVSAFATTNTAAASAGIAWVLTDVARGKKVSALGFCIGAVVGLVAITPAAGFVTISASLFIGIVASVISNTVAHFRTTKAGVDDTLDVFPCHGVGGMVGMLATGIFATSSINPAVTVEGLAYGQTTLFINHLIALVGCSLFAFGGSYLLFKITDFILPLRVSREDEKIGLDISQHDEQLLEMAS